MTKKIIHSKRIRCFLSLLVFSVVIMLSACSKKEHKFLLDLESNPSSGFEWEVVQADELFEVKKEYEEPKSGSKQDDGIDHFTLIPVDAGFTNVTFTYKQPKKGGEKRAEYAYTIIVGEDLQIEVISSTGSMGGAELGSKSIPVPGIE